MGKSSADAKPAMEVTRALRLNLSLSRRMAEALDKAAAEAESTAAHYARILLARALRASGHLA